MKVHHLLTVLVALLCLTQSPAGFLGFGKGSKLSPSPLRSLRHAADHAYDLEKTLLLHTYQTAKGVLGRLIPFLVLFFNKDAAEASPLNRQVVPIRGPFFQGWLLRSVDHREGVSIIFIVGSFSRSGSKIFSQ